MNVKLQRNKTADKKNVYTNDLRIHSIQQYCKQDKG